MSEIKIIHQPDDNTLESLGVTQWPIWSKESSDFPWHYDATETCYFIEGEVIVTPEGGEAVKMGKGDLVTFPQGMDCRWQILSDVKKHYMFES